MAENKLSEQLSDKTRDNSDVFSDNNALSDNLDYKLSDMSGLIVVLSNNARLAGLRGTPKPVKCEYCGTERYTEGISLGTGSILWYHKANACKCAQGQAKFEREEKELEERKHAEKQAEENRRMQEHVKKIISQSGLNEKFLQRTFENFDVSAGVNIGVKAKEDNNLKNLRDFAYNYANKLKNKILNTHDKRYSKAFNNGILKGPRPLSGVWGSAPSGFETSGFEASEGAGSLFISGNIGTGKTHIAAAIANYLMNYGIGVICMNERKLFNEIRRAYASNSNISENAVLELYSTVPLLIIDDMGKEKPTDWTLATLYAIIDARYESLMPVIITTNYDTKSLASRITPSYGYDKNYDRSYDRNTADAIVDRLSEMCKFILMTGQSRRG